MRPILYNFWLSSSSWRVRWALAIKGIDFEPVAVNLRKGEQLSPEHLSRNPMGHVPALMIDGRTLTESVAILEWLDETHPDPPLYPRDPWQRAQVRRLVETVNAGIQPLQNLAVLNRHSPDRAEQKAFAAHFNQRGLAALESFLDERGPFAAGDRLTAADLYLVPQVASARRFGVDVTAFPRVVRAEAAALLTEHAAAALPENQPDAPRT